MTQQTTPARTAADRTVAEAPSFNEAGWFDTGGTTGSGVVMVLSRLWITNQNYMSKSALICSFIASLPRRCGKEIVGPIAEGAHFILCRRFAEVAGEQADAGWIPRRA